MRATLLLLLLAPIAWAEPAAEPPVEEPRKVVTFDPCRGDRRCRIDRLRASQDERRRQEAARQAGFDAVEQKRIDALRRELMPVRAARPWGFDVTINPNATVGEVGFLAGYNVNAWWRVEAMISPVRVSDYGGTSYTSGDGVSLGGRVRWFLRDEDSAPYLSLGAFWHSLDVFRESWDPVPDDEGDVFSEPSYSSLDGEAHVALAAAGWEHTFRNGLRVGLELQYQKAWYVQATDVDSGIADAMARDGLESRYESEWFGVGFLAGWSF